MRFFVTGCAGFIGSNLTDRLLGAHHQVVGYDNFSTGRTAFLVDASRSEHFTLINGDLLDGQKLTEAMAGCEFVFHLAANADVRFGTNHPRKDLEQNTICTMNVLEAMRANGIRDIAFSSTGSIYGEASRIPTPENAEMPIQTSLYGASKLAAEGFIEAYCEGFGMRAFIFRFVSILGERYTHGHVVDFYKQLRVHPEYLQVLGNGTQRKSYLYVQDCLDAMLLAVENGREKVNLFNLGTDEYCQVNDSIDWDLWTPWSHPRIALQRRRSRLGGRQPIHLSGLYCGSLAWLATQAYYSAVGHPHGGISGAESCNCGECGVKVAIAAPSTSKPNPQVVLWFAEHDRVKPKRAKEIHMA